MQNKSFTHVLGIDISKKTLDLCLYDNKTILAQLKIDNTQIAVEQELQKLMQQYEKEITNLLCCAEFTGMYSYPLIQAVKVLNLPLWMENGAEIKLSSGVQRSKNDKVDAYRIACYAFRFMDKQKLYIHNNEAIESLTYLTSERELLIKDRAKYVGQLRDQKKFMNPLMYQQKHTRLQRIIQHLTEIIEEIEEQTQKIIEEDTILERQYEILVSIKGVGKQVALNTLIATQAFSRFTNPRKFSCHAGVAPFEQQSGSSQKSKNRVSKRANRKLKTLFHLAALSAIRVRGELQEYYLRKVAEGKNKMTVINAVRAKIIHRIFALIRDNRVYEDLYQNNLDLP